MNFCALVVSSRCREHETLLLHLRRTADWHKGMAAKVIQIAKQRKRVTKDSTSLLDGRAVSQTIVARGDRSATLYRKAEQLPQIAEE
jgi:hypothetical protein